MRYFFIILILLPLSSYGQNDQLIIFDTISQRGNQLHIKIYEFKKSKLVKKAIYKGQVKRQRFFLKKFLFWTFNDKRKYNFLYADNAIIFKERNNTFGDSIIYYSNGKIDSIMDKSGTNLVNEKIINKINKNEHSTFVIPLFNKYYKE